MYVSKVIHKDSGNGSVELAIGKTLEPVITCTEVFYSFC